MVVISSNRPLLISLYCLTAFLMAVNWYATNAHAGFLASWSSITTSHSRPTSAPPTCCHPGWTEAVPQSLTRSRASISTRTSCCLGLSASAWTCKAPTEPAPCCRPLFHPPSRLKVWSWKAVVLLLIVEKTAAVPTKASDRFTKSRPQCPYKEFTRTILKWLNILFNVKLRGSFNLINPLQSVGNGNNVSHFQCVLTLVTLWLWNNQTFRQGASLVWRSWHLRGQSHVQTWITGCYKGNAGTKHQG